jgi:hypothetical protein
MANNQELRALHAVYVACDFFGFRFFLSLIYGDFMLGHVVVGIDIDGLQARSI